MILSIVAGGLRRLFERRGEPLPEQLVALVPMSIRRPDEHLELGNRIATLMVSLPLSEADPVRRLERVREETTRVKQSEQARAASLVIEASGWTPPTINRVLADVLARPLTWNLVVSNVPGPQMPFYLLGRRMVEVYPFVPLSPQGHALSVGVVSYDGGVFFGLAGDRDLFADIDQVTGDLEAALSEQLRYCRMTTGDPSRTRLTSALTSSFAARTQPCEAAMPSGPVVPWIAIRSPPNQPEGRCGWRAVVATAQHP